MSVLRMRCHCVKFIRRFSVLPEYTEKPEYPPILDLSRDAVKKRNDEVWHNKIKNLEILEEKLMEVNMPRYYGWPCIGLFEGKVPYGSLQFAQYITRTFIVTQQELPMLYQAAGIVDLCAPILDHVKNSIKEAIVLEHAVERSPSGELKDNGDDVNELGDAIVHQINRVIISSLSADFPHLQTCQVDHFPRIESFWIVGGIDPPKRLEKIRKTSNNGDLGKPVDVKFQYLGRPIAQLRHELPLQPAAIESEIQKIESNVPEFHYDPRVLGVDKLQRHVTNIPGFWPGDKSEFPLMSFHSSKYLANRSSYDDSEAAPYVHAVLASFAWLQALACYKGFSTFQDVTYPLLTQTVLTDGQYWSFYVYQLNTMLLHSNHATENQKCNLCWGTKKLKLFDKIENGKVVGFNEEVLKILLYFYLNVPHVRSGVELKPYLGVNNRYIADIPEKDKRVWLEKHFKHMYSNRPRKLLADELYHWEKIYKVDHKTRPQEPRRRPFELGQFPLERRYDDHTPAYVRKSERTVKWKKFEKTYYP
ncbi:Uncharacterized protein GBIM_03711 [Gryllus bimaculatus]|nr:Uncharacterized protein GBIM_03711 [Gryllus bimaculatus]